MVRAARRGGALGIGAGLELRDEWLKCWRSIDSKRETRNPKPRFALELAAVKPALSARFFHSYFYVSNL